MFNNFIADGLGKISEVIAWALGGSSGLTGDKRTEILLVSSVSNKKVDLTSGVCLTAGLQSGFCKQLNNVSGFCLQTRTQSGFCKQLNFTSSIILDILDKEVDLTSGFCLATRFQSGFCKQSTAASGFCLQTRLQSGFCKQLNFTSSIKTRLLNEVINGEIN